MNNISLNSLKILNAVIEHRSAVDAAKALNVSCASISYTLKKIRQQTGYSLFKRTRYALIPDEHALELQKKYWEISALSTHRREFIITTYSPIELLLGLVLQETEKDDLLLRFSSMPDSAEQRLINLRNREVDIDIGSRLPEDNAIACYSYLQSEMCVMVSENHTTIKETLTEEDWYENLHITWSRGSNDFYDIINTSNLSKDIISKRKTACESTSLLAMAHLCAHSDHIMMIPQVFAAALQTVYPVKSYRLPWDISLYFSCCIHYHREISKNPNVASLLKIFDGVFGK
jgi:DNA-binding transcriptional LysR family regulator